MRNMLDRSLGAANFGGFWRHWNPIWSYGLARYIMAPLTRAIPFPAALVLTFAASGLVHDLVIMALRRELALLFTPWFVLCALLVVLGNRLGWRVTHKPWAVRAALNLFQLAATAGIAMFTMDKFGLW
ncbi:MBOAT family O-acyltransferase [Erythrobacter litoralis]|uniref:MBOAT family O-acyltransferase n=1 Tax=Erythrobacter litoralis TaxID=39960 RepID=UPI00243501A5|nr:MBOAT family O-acyltransferase [Erythrobacter litoralis]